MRKNQKTPSIHTHEGGKAKPISEEAQLRRSVMSCLLWEKSFYEDGDSIADRIKNLIPLVNPIVCKEIAIEARNVMHLRHVPLLIAREMARHPLHKRYVTQTLKAIIQRPDELMEFLALYWLEGKKPLAYKVKQGLKFAFQKFTEYQFAKYDRDYAIKLRDVLFMVHSKPKDVPHDSPKFTKKERKLKSYELGINENGIKTIEEGKLLEINIPKLIINEKEIEFKLCSFQNFIYNGRILTSDEILYYKIINRELTPPDTWEVALSAGGDKKETFERLMNENKLFSLAFLRNLRNMIQANINIDKIREYGRKLDFSKILPFQFIAAAFHNSAIESFIEELMIANIKDHSKLSGETAILVDISGSMSEKLSKKSEMRRIDAAIGIAILCRELCENVSIYKFNEEIMRIPDRRGFSLKDCLMQDFGGGTSLGHALKHLLNHVTLVKDKKYDRLIVITDEQTNDSIINPRYIAENNYLINIACEKNGVGYHDWIHIDGFSDGILKYIISYEQISKN